jgi:hypothetical protein
MVCLRPDNLLPTHGPDRHAHCDTKGKVQEANMELAFFLTHPEEELSLCPPGIVDVSV